MNDGALLIATRFIKGIATAFTVPAGLSIITTTFAEGPARNKALAIYTGDRRERLVALPARLAFARTGGGEGNG